MPRTGTVLAAASDSGSSVDDCWEAPGSVCSFVYENLGQSESLASASDWLVDRPLRVLLIIAVAWILTRLARRWVASIVGRLISAPPNQVERLERLGLELPSSLAPAGDPRRESRSNSISAVLTSTTVVTIWTIAVLTALGTLGVELGPLIAGAGIAGVALGFGAQTLVRDCIAGFFMLAEDQYGIGDVVDLGEASGVVEEVSLRTTVLRSVDGTVWHVPNGVVQRVGNKSQLWSVALVDVDVAYDTDLVLARTLLHQAADEVCRQEEFEPYVIEPPTVLGVEALAADGITLRLTVKVQPGQQWPLQREIRQHVKDVFDAAGIEIPFPQRTVWMRVEPDADDRDGPDPTG